MTNDPGPLCPRTGAQMPENEQTVCYIEIKISTLRIQGTGSTFREAWQMAQRRLETYISVENFQTTSKPYYSAGYAVLRPDCNEIIAGCTNPQMLLKMVEQMTVVPE